ncbi:MAG: ArsR family transcriptional regulator [Methanolinea sp.]|jgi:flavodoxin|nr:ArsR family transcriptional regulator [Methanolinea sp.]
MKICIVFHSYSGITRGIAGKLKASCGGDLVEVIPHQKYGTLSAYTVGCLRARNQEYDPIDPDVIDVSAYDLIVFGTPVWAFKPTPAVNAAVASLKGSQGKKAVIFATCGGKPGETIPLLKQALAGKGVNVVGEMVFTRGEVQDRAKIDGLVRMVMMAVDAK